MKVTGIIAEYNPFHQGHAYQIKTLRKEQNPDYVVVAMSGDFLQRGTPAFCDKYTRARMALQQGVDMVLELPSYFSTSSAECFARGGIFLFRTTGIVDTLCFSTETAETEALQTLAEILAFEPDWYQQRLLSYLKEGFSFPLAREKALPEFSYLLKTPNNILGIEYLKALFLFAPEIQPWMILRKGSGYHETNIQTPFASATSIRSFLQKTPDRISSLELQKALPEVSYSLLQEYGKTSSFLTENDFSLLLHHTLLKETKDSLTTYQDISPAIANRLLGNRNHFSSWSDFCKKCNTKETTYTRISRCLTHILLNIKTESLASYVAKDSATILPYLRILGFRKNASPLLKALKQNAKAPVLTNPSAAHQELSPAGMAMLETDLFASDLYRCVLTAKTGKVFVNEYQRKLLVV